MKTLGIALAGGLLIALTAGCPKDPYDPDTWIEKLDEPKEAGEALQRLQQLKDPKAIKPLGEFWKSHRHPSKVLRILIELASYQRVDPKTGEVKYGPTYEPAIPYLIEAVDQFDIGDQQSIDDAVVAADALGRAAELGIQSPEAVTTLIAAVKKDIPKLSPGQRVRIGAVRALGYMKDPRAVDLLIDVLTTPPTKQPIKLNAAAANALANQADPKAIQPLLKTMFALPPVYQQVRTALTAIGKPVVPELVKIFKGQHKELNQYAKEQNFANDCDKGQGPNTTCKAPGALKFKAATLLGDFRATEHVAMLAAELKEPPLYSYFDPETGAGGPPTHNAVLDALRTIGEPSAADAVYAYWNDANTRLDIKPIAIDVYSMLEDKPSERVLSQLADMFKNDAEDEGVRLAASLAYGRLAYKKQHLEPLDYMIDRFKKPADENAKKADAEAKKAEKYEKIGADYEKKALADKKNQQALMKKANDAFAKAEGHRDEEARLRGVSDSYRGYQRGFEESKWRAEVGIECGSDPMCYAKYLDAKDIAVGKPGLPKAERALIQLAKLGPKAAPALDALLKHVDTSERIVRQGILLALTRVAPKPCDRCVQRLDEVIKAQENQTTLDYLTADTRIVRNYFRWAGR